MVFVRRPWLGQGNAGLIALHRLLRGPLIMYSVTHEPCRSGPCRPSFWRQSVSLLKCLATVFQECAGHSIAARNCG
jgi:hypothetical protein